MWAALRRNQRDTATTALLLSCFAVWGTMSNAGPFVSSSLNESFLLLLTFVISVSVPSLALSADVAVRRRHEEHVSFVMRELSHRSKNLLSIVQSMATQVARQTDSFDDFCVGFSRRLGAFAETHDLLVMGDWHGADIRDLIRTHLAPFHNLGDNSVLFEGPELKLNPKAAEQIGLAEAALFHLLNMVRESRTSLLLTSRGWPNSKRSLPIGALPVCATSWLILLPLFGCRISPLGSVVR